MKANTAVLPIVLVLSFLILGTSSPAAADAGVFTGNGQNLRQISSKSIQLVSIDVSIIPGRGPFLFDGTVPGVDQVQYECTFILAAPHETALRDIAGLIERGILVRNP